MISTARLGRLYSYKRIYGKVYIVCLNNRKIIRIRDVRFYKRSVPDGNIEEEALFKAVFNEETEEFTFRTIHFKTIFGSGKSLAPQTPITSQF